MPRLCRDQARIKAKFVDCRFRLDVLVITSMWDRGFLYQHASHRLAHGVNEKIRT